MADTLDWASLADPAAFVRDADPRLELIHALADIPPEQRRTLLFQLVLVLIAPPKGVINDAH